MRSCESRAGDLTACEYQARPLGSRPRAWLCCLIVPPWSDLVFNWYRSAERWAHPQLDALNALISAPLSLGFDRHQRPIAHHTGLQEPRWMSLVGSHGDCAGVGPPKLDGRRAAAAGRRVLGDNAGLAPK